MKAILEFNLPEDTDEHHVYFQANNMYVSLHEMQEFLRKKIKYADDDVSYEALDAYEECRKYLNQVLIDNDLSLEI